MLGFGLETRVSLASLASSRGAEVPTLLAAFEYRCTMQCICPTAVEDPFLQPLLWPLTRGKVRHLTPGERETPGPRSWLAARQGGPSPRGSLGDAIGSWTRSCRFPTRPATGIPDVSLTAPDRVTWFGFFVLLKGLWSDPAAVCRRAPTASRGHGSKAAHRVGVHAGGGGRGRSRRSVASPCQWPPARRWGRAPRTIGPSDREAGSLAAGHPSAECNHEHGGVRPRPTGSSTFSASPQGEPCRRTSARAVGSEFSHAALGARARISPSLSP